MNKFLKLTSRNIVVNYKDKEKFVKSERKTLPTDKKQAYRDNSNLEAKR